MSQNLLEQCKRLKLNIFLSYGMTETCSSICGFWPFENNNYIGSVGKAFKGVQLNIKDNIGRSALIWASAQGYT